MKKQFFLFRPKSVFQACLKALKKSRAKIIQLDEGLYCIQAVICHSFVSDKINLDIRVVANSPEACCVEIKSTLERKGLINSRKSIQWEMEFLDTLFLVITGTPSCYQAFDKSESFLKYLELSRQQRESVNGSRNIIWHVSR